jgi:hypothetical protein
MSNDSDIYETMDMADELGEGQALHTGALESQITRHTENQRKKAAALAQKYGAAPQTNKPSFLSGAWFKAVATWPFRHIRDNASTIVMSTLAGGALASLGALAMYKGLGMTPDAVSVMKTAALSYPAWRLLDGGFARVGFYTGHILNAAKRDRFREVKTEPAGRWFGRSLAIATAFMGAAYGHTYLNTVKDLTLNLPSTITQSVPSFVADNLDLENTKYDMVWELKDQAKCLTIQAVDPSHICLNGPGAENIPAVINGEATNIDLSQELTAYQRATQSTGTYVDEHVRDSWLDKAWKAVPSIDMTFATQYLPDVPSEKEINNWVNEQIGITAPQAPTPS